jgi:DDB1- and CUL4-associated factor 13
METERVARAVAANIPAEDFSNWEIPRDKVAKDQRDLDWSTVMKRTFEAYVRGELPNMYGEWLQW